MVTYEYFTNCDTWVNTWPWALAYMVYFVCFPPIFLTWRNRFVRSSQNRSLSRVPPLGPSTGFILCLLHTLASFVAGGALFFVWSDSTTTHSQTWAMGYFVSAMAFFNLSMYLAVAKLYVFSRPVPIGRVALGVSLAAYIGAAIWFAFFTLLTLCYTVVSAGYVAYWNYLAWYIARKHQNGLPRILVFEEG